MTAWNDAPGSKWYGEVVYGRSWEIGSYTGTETDYAYGYSNDEEPPAVELLLPEGMELIESRVELTSAPNVTSGWA